jgi:hypothetical protein
MPRPSFGHLGHDTPIIPLESSGFCYDLYVIAARAEGPVGRPNPSRRGTPTPADPRKHWAFQAIPLDAGASVLWHSTCISVRHELRTPRPEHCRPQEPDCRCPPLRDQAGRSQVKARRVRGARRARPRVRDPRLGCRLHPGLLTPSQALTAPHSRQTGGRGFGRYENQTLSEVARAPQHVPTHSHAALLGSP